MRDQGLEHRAQHFVCCVFRPAIVKILNPYIILLCTHMFPSFQYLSIVTFRRKKYLDFMTLKYAKSCFSVKKLIWTSERHEEHPFAG